MELEVKNILLGLILVSSFYVSVTATFCHNDGDPKKCNKVIQGKVHCINVTQFSRICDAFPLLCGKHQRVCWRDPDICTVHCCHGWALDSFGRCTISTHIHTHPRSRADFEKPKDVSTMITGILVVLLIVILGMMSVAMFRFRRTRQNYLQRQRTRRAESTNANGRSSIYTIYDNEPPPYEIVIQSKLPEYSESDSPPDYYASNTANGGTEGAFNMASQPGRISEGLTTGSVRPQQNGASCGNTVSNETGSEEVFNTAAQPEGNSVHLPPATLRTQPNAASPRSTDNTGTN